MVLFMTPGLAFFYGGLVRVSSVVSMMMMSFGSIALVGTLWVVYGYAMSFGGAGGAGFVGFDGVFGIDTNKLFLADVFNAAKTGSGFDLVFAGFQGTFAIITVALISGAIADRARFGSWMVFAALWATFAYFPIAGWVFNFTLDNGQITDGGWLVKDVGLLDFAGGTAVEVASGAGALAIAIVVGKRFGFSKGMNVPHNVPLTLIGAGILWFGWFGFNAGSALSAGSLAATAMINTQIASAAAAMSWITFEKFRDGKATTLGVASGAIAGAVVITPACGYVNPIGALILGLIAGVASSYAVSRKYKFGYDDSLDVVGVHGVSGIVGMIGIGLFATATVNATGKEGLFINGSPDLLIKQLIAIVAVAAFSFCATWLIATVITRTIGFRVPRDEELTGLDTTYHAESAYDITGNSNRY